MSTSMILPLLPCDNRVCKQTKTNARGIKAKSLDFSHVQWWVVHHMITRYSHDNKHSTDPGIDSKAF